jgi:hypothetical protein
MKYTIEITVENGDTEDLELESETEPTREEAQAFVDDWVRKNVVGVVLSVEEA